MLIQKIVHDLVKAKNQSASTSPVGLPTCMAVHLKRGTKAGRNLKEHTANVDHTIPDWSVTPTLTHSDMREQMEINRRQMLEQKW